MSGYKELVWKGKALEANYNKVDEHLLPSNAAFEHGMKFMSPIRTHTQYSTNQYSVIGQCYGETLVLSLKDKSWCRLWSQVEDLDQRFIIGVMDGKRDVHVALYVM